MYKNHEGYSDPTAGKALRRWERKKKPLYFDARLTYQIGELRAFKKVKRQLRK